MIEGISLRAEMPEDKEFVAALYASTRSDEMKLVPWDEAQKRAFLQQQFEFQTHHYRNVYADAKFEIVLGQGKPIGRLYVQRTQDAIHLMDISLVSEHRGKGIGTDLLKTLLEESASTGKPVRIFVEMNNPALRLYTRLGFQPIDTQGIYIQMKWIAGSSAPEDEMNGGTPGSGQDKTT